MQLTKLILETTDLSKLHQFYGNVMEMPLSANKHGFKISLGKTDLIFQENNQLDDPVYHYAITIPSNKIDEAKEWLKDRVKLIWIEEYQSVIADFFNWNAKSVYFFDVAGNIVELISRFDLKNETDEPFDSRQFLSVSEIGIVFKEDEIELRSKVLMNTYSLPYFSKQPPLPSFKVLGDDHGLFIIVPENRNWFATTITSKVLPLDIEFENGGKHYHAKF